MTIDGATGSVRIPGQEGVGWVSALPVCPVSNAPGRAVYIEIVCCPYPAFRGWAGRSAE